MKLHLQAKADASLAHAQAALAAQRPHEALPHAVQARRLSPDDAAIALLIGQIQLQLHQASEAMASLDLAALLDEKSEHSLTIRALRAQALAALDRDVDAVALLEALIAQCPGDAHFRRLAAAAYERIGSIDRAIAHLQVAGAVEPTHSITRRHLAHLLSADNPQASLKFVPQNQASPQTPAAQWQAAQWMKQAGRQRDAEETYRELIAARPHDAALLAEAGIHADALGEVNVAIARLTLALTQRDADQRAVRLDLARAFAHAGRFAGAAWHWWLATRQDPQNAHAWAGLIISAFICERAHLVELAQRRLERLADEDERVFLLAEAWMDASAGEVILRASDCDDVPAPTASPLTWILERSVEVLSTQVVRKPGWADTLYHTAICENALGDDDSARQHVQAALDINPHYRAATTLAAQLPKAA